MSLFAGSFDDIVIDFNEDDETIEETPPRSASPSVEEMFSIDEAKPGINLQALGRKPTPESVHEKMMTLALEDAGYWSFGIKAIEVWVYNSDGKLELSPGGSWIDRVYFANNDEHISEALKALYDPNSERFERVDSIVYAPGEGLPGALWAENSNISNNSYVRWRDVEGLAGDPDQPFNPRLQLTAKAGFHRAAGVPFNANGASGIVVYLARKSAKLEKLCDKRNEEFILTATESIGAIQALQTKRSVAAESKSGFARDTFQRAIKKIIFMNRLTGYNIQFSSMKPQPERQPSKREKLERIMKNRLSHMNEQILIPSKVFVNQWFQKMRGSNVQPTPGISNETAIFTALACFTTVYSMLALTHQILSPFDFDHAFISSQLASVSVMVYTLTASPAAQPRNILLGRLISIFVGMTVAFIRIPENMELRDYFGTPLHFLRFSLAVSLSSALMAKFGVPHPPGGSLSVYFTQFKLYKLGSYKMVLSLLIHDCVFILLVATLNNLNASRSYPTFWGYTPNRISSYLRTRIRKKALTSSMPVNEDFHFRT